MTDIVAAMASVRARIDAYNQLLAAADQAETIGGEAEDIPTTLTSADTLERLTADMRQQYTALQADLAMVQDLANLLSEQIAAVEDVQSDLEYLDDMSDHYAEQVQNYRDWAAEQAAEQPAEQRARRVG